MSTITEDQEQELEALESIYPNELSVISRSPVIQFSIHLKQIDDSNEDNEFAVKLGFEFRPGYPETETPIISILETTNLLEEDEEELLSLLKTEAKASLGMVMIFTLVSVASEWLNKRKDEDEKRKVEAIEKKKRDAEEMEMKRFEGTRVTVESFLKWKFSFDAEMAQVKSKTQQKESTASSRKLTGRELFEKDTTLYESDLAFLEEGDLTSGGVSLDDAGVTINDDLFDPDDDEDDDPDFDPNDAVDDD